MNIFVDILNNYPDLDIFNFLSVIQLRKGDLEMYRPTHHIDACLGSVTNYKIFKTEK